MMSIICLSVWVGVYEHMIMEINCLVNTHHLQGSSRWCSRECLQCFLSSKNGSSAGNETASGGEEGWGGVVCHILVGHIPTQPAEATDEADPCLSNDFLFSIGLISIPHPTYSMCVKVVSPVFFMKCNEAASVFLMIKCEKNNVLDFYKSV